jgi:hypothetical protein
MRIYLAAPYSARDRLRDVVGQLAVRGHVVTSRWLWDDHEIQSGTEGAALDQSAAYITQHTLQDLQDIETADLLVLFTGSWIDSNWVELRDTRLHSGGRHVETGYALATSTPVLYLGAPENVFHRGMCEGIMLLSEMYSFLEGKLVCIECGNDFAAEGLVRCPDCAEKLF